MRDGKVLRFGGYGESNTESKTPVTAKTVFAIASISKQFLAADPGPGWQDRSR
jgi:CubicO group peptidase (beta-lactamase class C family)